MVGSGMRRNPRDPQACALSTWVDGMPSLAGEGVARPGRGDVGSAECIKLEVPWQYSSQDY